MYTVRIEVFCVESREMFTYDFRDVSPEDLSGIIERAREFTNDTSTLCFNQAYVMLEEGLG